MDLRTLIKDYLAQTHLLQVVTSKDNQPWACTVHFAVDDDLNLYWLSKPTTRHSTELRQNSKVAGAVVRPHKLGDVLRGLQLQGTAQELMGETTRVEITHYVKKFGLQEKRILEIVADTDGHRLYKLTPTMFTLFDLENFPENPRQEYNLQ